MTSSDPLVGKQFDGRYEVLSRLGEGGMGAVYVARQVAMDRQVALKVVHPSQAVDEVVVKRFEREMRTSSKISHPNVIRVYDWGKTPDGAFFLAMELLDGESLEDVLDREGALPVDRALHVGSQILKALGAAHAANVVHRDLKPGNVMLCRVVGEPDQVRVLDFGVATFGPGDEEPSARITATGVVVGTPSYVSPEQIGGEAVDPRSDLYSFGCVLYRMIAGRLPFEESRPLRVLQMHMTETPKAPSAVAPQPIPPWLDRLVMQLLAKYSDDRPASADAVLATIDENGGTPPPASPAPDRPRSVLAPAGPGPLWMGGVLLVVAVVFGLGGVVLGLLLR